MAHPQAPLLIGAVLLALLAVFAEPVQAQVVGAGGAHTCALLDDGTVKCWGSNDNGRLGQGDTRRRGDDPDEMGGDLPAIALGTGRTATALAVGGSHTCVLLDDASVKCWGSNDNGRLGAGNTDHLGDDPDEMGDDLPAIDLGTGRTATAISAGIHHVCALLDNGSVKCWGRNTDGQLGLGDTDDRGDDEDEMGDDLPAVDLGTGRTATAIIAGNLHTCALLDDSSLKCWGSNNNGRLGLGDDDNRGDDADEMGDDLPAINLGTGRTATAVSVGSITCAVLDDGSLKCWGPGTNGRLGLGDTDARGDGADEMGDDLPAVALGTGRTATAVEAGGSHTCALLDNGDLKCWGGNGNGRLGLGDTNNRGDDADEMGDDLPAVALGTGRNAIDLDVRENHTCALLDNGSVKCWGRNTEGQLGQGDTNNRGDDADEMGDDLPAVDLDGAILPVELTAFDVFTDHQQRVHLRWSTRSETLNAGFDIQIQPGSADGAAYRSIGFQDGAGTTLQTQHYAFETEPLAPGRYRLRLRQVDYDGTAAYHGPLEVSVSPQGSVRAEAPYPNPFGAESEMVVTVPTSQWVEVTLYDALGRRVASLFAGRVEALAGQVVRVPGQGLPSGVYVVRVEGERFAVTHRLTRLR